MLDTHATVQFTVEMPINDTTTGASSSLGEITARAADLARAQVKAAFGDQQVYIQQPVVLSVTIGVAADPTDETAVAADLSAGAVKAAL